MFALVDACDYKWLNQWKWYAQKGKNTYYAERNEWVRGKRVRIIMHRLIMSAKRGEMIDHKFGNGLDNQKKNLRFCTPSQNGANKIPRGSSAYMGVSYCKRNSKWLAVIQYKNKQTFIGYFKEEKDAASAYNELAIVVHGEFANLNKI